MASQGVSSCTRGVTQYAHALHLLADTSQLESGPVFADIEGK